MTIPEKIPFSSIIFGERRREKYNGIDELAESVEEVGLQCPIILSPIGFQERYIEEGVMTEIPVSFLLEDGGRRYSALKLLNTQFLFHATTCDPDRPGFVLKSEPATKRSHWLTELVANLHRDALTWTESLGLIVDAYKEFVREGAIKGERVYMHTVGALLGVTYNDVQAATMVYERYQANPELFADCNTLLMAYKKVLRLNQLELESELAKQLAPSKVSVIEVIEMLDGKQKEALVPSRPELLVDFSSHFCQGNSLLVMENLQPEEAFDHIICDPDFAIAQDLLESNSVSAGEGIVQQSVEKSLADLHRLIPLAYKCLRPTGFFIFWYDLDHHEKLQFFCKAAGFSVQRWPLIWHKPGFASNAAPQYNFCKNIEYAMVCRKGGAMLTKPQTSTLISLPTANIAKTLGHPFAKPPELWKWIYNAVATPGQTTFDPFLGSGSSVIAALRCGLVPSGCELDEQHFSTATINIHNEYSSLNPNHEIKFQ